jgi:hypothetical protein
MRFKKKQPGFALIVVMLLVSSISLLVMSISYKVYKSRGMSSTFKLKSNEWKILANGIAVAQSILSGEVDNPNKDKEGSKNESEIKIRHLNIFWKYAYKWTKFVFDYDYDGVDGEISIYLMNENSKIPLKGVLDKVIKIKNKDNEKGDKNSSDKDSANLQESSGQKAAEGDGDKELFNDPYIKGFFEFFKQDVSKSETLKKYVKAVDKDSSSAGDDSGGEIFKKWIQNFLSFNYKVHPFSWNYFLGKYYDSKSPIYRSSCNEPVDSSFLTEVLSIYSDKICMASPSPHVLKLSSKKFVLSDEMRNKVLEKIKNSTKEKKSGIDTNAESLWRNIYKEAINVDYPKKMCDELGKNNLLDDNCVPEIYTALFDIHTKSGSLTAYVVFEKLSLSENWAIGSYFVKQLLIL